MVNVTNETSECDLIILKEYEKYGIDPEMAKKEFPDWTRKLSLVLFIISACYFSITLLWWFARRKHYLIRKRSTLFMVLSTMGSIFLTVGVQMRVYSGLSSFSCDLYNWRLVGMPCVMGPIVVRLVLFYNRSRFSQMLLDRGHRDVAIEDYNNLTPLNAFCTYFSSFLSMSALREAAKSMCCYPDLERSANVVEAPFERNNDEMRTEYNNVSVDPNTGGVDVERSQLDSREPSVCVGSAQILSVQSLSGSQRQLLIAYFKTTNVYGLMVLAIFVFCVTLYVGSKAFHHNTPYGGKGCVGCHADRYDAAVLGGTILGIGIVGIYVMFHVNLKEDALGVAKELRSCLWWILATVAMILFTAIDPRRIQQDRVFPLVIFVPLFLMGLHFVQCPLQVYKTKCPLFNWCANCEEEIQPESSTFSSSAASYTAPISIKVLSNTSKRFMHCKSWKNEKHPGNNNNNNNNNNNISHDSATDPTISNICVIEALSRKPSLEEVIASPEGKQAFVKQLSREHSVEVYYLIDAVQRFKGLRASDSSTQSTRELAFKIYRTFVADHSILQVNVSSNASRELNKAIMKLKDNPDCAPQDDLFDKILREVIEMVRRDSFQRFLLSDLFQEYIKQIQEQRQISTA